MKPRVLFVDDDRDLLAAMRDRLRRQRSVWDLAFFDAPRDALEHVRKAGVDVVVSDVRMPDMDGGDLLANVRSMERAALRIALSGQTDLETAARVHGVAHLFLSKPCDVGLIVELVERRRRLGELIPLAALELVASAPEIPAIPTTYRELETLFAREDWAREDAARIVERDAVVSAHLVRVASSPFFGARHITSVEVALMRLGARMTQRLVGALQASEAFSKADAIEPWRLAEHAAHARATAARMAELSTPARAGDAYVLGLLHHIGQLVVATTHPTQTLAIELAIREHNAPRQEVEREILGYTHAHVSAALLAYWGFPCELVEAVLFHHDDEGGGELATWLRTATAALRSGPLRRPTGEAPLGGAR